MADSPDPRRNVVKQMIAKIWKITALTRLDRATYQVISW